MAIHTERFKVVLCWSVWKRQIKGIDVQATWLLSFLRSQQCRGDWGNHSAPSQPTRMAGPVFQTLSLFLFAFSSWSVQGTSLAGVLDMGSGVQALICDTCQWESWFPQVSVKSLHPEVGLSCFGAFVPVQCEPPLVITEPNDGIIVSYKGSNHTANGAETAGKPLLFNANPCESPVGNDPDSSREDLHGLGPEKHGDGMFLCHITRRTQDIFVAADHSIFDPRVLAFLMMPRIWVI